MMVPPNSYFRTYSGNALRLKDAKALSIVEGEQRNGVELMIPLKHLHQIAGVVVATSDGHLLRRDFVQLLYADDHSITLSRIGHMSTTMAHFVLNVVQDGGYLLKVRARDAASDALKRTIQT